MVIGTGLLGEESKKYFAKRDDILVFASGVSNSQCVDKNQFIRENILLSEHLNNHKDVNYFIYYSTISIEDKSMSNSQYIKHKINMESLVSSHKNPYIIRLGQIASKNKGNPNNILNYLTMAIKSNKNIKVWINAKRSIIDIQDIPEIVSKLIIQYPQNKKVINVANPGFTSVKTIISILENALNEKGIYSYVDKGHFYNINLKKMLSVIPMTKIKFDNEYLFRVIEKYYSQK